MVCGRSESESSFAPRKNAAERPFAERKTTLLCVHSPGAPIAATDRAAVWHGNLTSFSFRVQMLAVDPPWRQGNLSYWSHKAGIEQRWDTFVVNMTQHFHAREVVYLKTGAPEVPAWEAALRGAGFRQIVSWPTHYYGGDNAQIVALRSRPPFPVPMREDSRAATTAIAAWAWKLGIMSVADPCVGLGKMLAKFLNQGLYVAGVELVESRANAAAKRLCGGGG